jgi:hypothetical protein
MRRSRWIVVSAFVAGLVSSADAAHHPLDDASLTITRARGGKMKLTFVAKDPAFLFPAIGSADDPGTGTPGGLTLQIASTAQPSAVTITAPAGVGKPGWRAKDGSRDSHVYTNPDAGPGPLPIETVVLRQGSSIKVVARFVHLNLAGPQGTVGVRLTTGTHQNCAWFDAPTIRKDVANHFKAKGSFAGGRADCLNLLPLPPTTTSTSTTTTTSLTTSTTIVFPSCGPVSTCGGPCAPGDTCLPMIDFQVGGVFICQCIPPDVEPCRSEDFPTCGGQCSNGGVCQAIDNHGTHLCGCVHPTGTCGGSVGSCSAGPCPPGQVCTATSVGGFEVCGCG